MIAALAFNEARGESPARVTPTSAFEAGWTGYAPVPVALEGLMTQKQVIAAIGPPESVFRKNAQAECWAYESPYEIRLCFRPKRRLAWWSASTPPPA